jgi:hypothetical protein
MEDAQSSPHRRPDLIAEAVSQLILAANSRSRKLNEPLGEDILTRATDLLSKWLQRNGESPFLHVSNFVGQ